MVTLDQPYQLEFFKLAQVVSRLKLEVATDLKFRQPTLKHARRYYNLDARRVRRKEEAIAILEPAKDAALYDPPGIWRILAKVRMSEVFLTCGVCGWQGDTFTCLVENEEWVCPKCKTDASGMTVERLEKNAD